ncbi:MAG: hypothetical protein LBR61_11030, partial [Synergistaceae bacterium]|nr:hypothetical protein [Synergistaceae bacterium]
GGSGGGTSGGASNASLLYLAGQKITTTGGAGTIQDPKLAAITVANSVATITEADIVSAAGSTGILYSDTHGSNQHQPIALPEGGVAYACIEVDAADGVTKMYYKVTVTRPNALSGVTNPTPTPTTSSGSGAGSTDITSGGVNVATGDGGNVNCNIERQPDGTWILVLPNGTDLSNLVLNFTLPDAGTQISPLNGSAQDFSNGRVVYYTVISTDGTQTTTYPICVTTRTLIFVRGGLVETEGWSLQAAKYDDGSYSFKILAPLDPDEYSVTASHLPSRVYVSLGKAYSHVTLGILDADGRALTPFREGIPVTADVTRNKASADLRATGSEPATLEIEGVARSLSDLEGLFVEEVDWRFADEPDESHRQTILPPLTYHDIVSKGRVTSPAGVERSGKGGGGCAAAGLFSGAWLLLIPMLGKKKRK